MAKCLLLVASLLVLVALSLATEEPRKAQASDPKIGEEKQVVGGFNQIENIKDPKIQNLGKFAVREHNKQAKTHLKFQEVYDGKYQIVQGTNYELKLSALDGIVSRTYGALVFVDINKKPELQDFYGISRN